MGKSNMQIGMANVKDRTVINAMTDDLMENNSALHSLCGRLENVIERLVGPEPEDSVGNSILEGSTSVFDQLSACVRSGRLGVERLGHICERLDQLI